MKMLSSACSSLIDVDYADVWAFNLTQSRARMYKVGVGACFSPKIANLFTCHVSQLILLCPISGSIDIIQGGFFNCPPPLKVISTKKII